MRCLLSVAAFASLCLLSVGSSAQELNGFEARSFKGSKGLTLPYRLFKVANPVAGTQYPLILFLHGAGERGSDNAAQLTANAGATVWATAAHQAKHAAYVIAPQCPSGEQWVHTDWSLGSYSTSMVPVSDPLTTALEIADAIAKEFGTDPARQYITGLSMGGYGTWDAVIRNPNRFAAALPICGAGDPSKADLIKLLPLWTFHGDADPTVPVKGSRDMVAALKAVGSTVKYTEYPGVMHDAWDMTYANEEVIDWLFQFTTASAGSGGGGAGNAGGSSGGATTGGTDSSGGSGNGGASAGAPSGAAAGMFVGGGGTGGSSNSAGSSSIGTAGTGAVTPPADDSGCRFAPPRPVRSSSAWLGAIFVVAAVSRRRNARAAA